MPDVTTFNLGGTARSNAQSANTAATNAAKLSRVTENIPPRRKPLKLRPQHTPQLLLSKEVNNRRF